MLDDELIAELERRWSAQSPALLQRLQPGLDDLQIDEAAHPLDFPLPEEVRRWYRWNNGSAGWPVILWRAFDSLAEDVARTLEFEEDEEAWPKGWMKVMDEQPFIIFDCRGASEAPVPVWHYDYAFDRPVRPVYDSIGDMVTLWIKLIDDGHLTWDANGEGHLAKPFPPDIAERLGGVPTE